MPLGAYSSPHWAFPESTCKLEACNKECKTLLTLFVFMSGVRENTRGGKESRGRICLQKSTEGAASTHKSRAFES